MALVALPHFWKQQGNSKIPSGWFEMADDAVAQQLLSPGAGVNYLQSVSDAVDIVKHDGCILAVSRNDELVMISIDNV